LFSHFIFVISIYSQIYAEEQSITLKYKVNDDLITNYDIVKEAKYLAALILTFKILSKTITRNWKEFPD
jgi:hypothetical protein